MFAFDVVFVEVSGSFKSGDRGGVFKDVEPTAGISFEVEETGEEIGDGTGIEMINLGSLCIKVSLDTGTCVLLEGLLFGTESRSFVESVLLLLFLASFLIV